MLELGVAGSRKDFLGVAELLARFVGMIEATKPWIILLTGVADFCTYFQGRNYPTKMWINPDKQLIHDLVASIVPTKQAKIQRLPKNICDSQRLPTLTQKQSKKG